MKKLFLILSVAMFSLGSVDVFAQDNANEGAAPAATEEVEATAEAAPAAVDAEAQIAGESLHHVMMQKFLEGGWAWMLPILIFLIIQYIKS